MKNKIKIKRGNEVVVISGSQKGKRGKILELIMAKGRVIVEGVALKKKHVKATPENTEGGVIEREGSVHISNVMSAEKFDAKKNKAN